LDRFVSHYEVVEMFGRGATAEVYLARDLKLDRQVALKVLAADLFESDEARQRFEREARVAAKLDHPNITAIYEIDEVKGRYFIAMSFSDGDTLASVLKRERPSMNESLSILDQVAEGLEYAHDRGILHRDIKPANIYKCRHGPVRILDFGLATGYGSTSLTRTGAVLGTPAYISPEQLESQPADVRCDIYSLGVVAYELWTGERPFHAESLNRLFYLILNEDPLARLAGNASIPRPAVDFLRRLLARDPRERHQNMSDVKTALREMQETLTTTATSGSTAARFNKKIAVLPFVNSTPAQENEYFSDGMTEELIHVLGHVEGLGVASRTSVFQYKNVARDVREIGRMLEVDAILEGSVRRSSKSLRVTVQLVNPKDGCHLWSERYDREMENVFAIQDDIAESIARALEGRLLAVDQDALSRKRTTDLQAYEHYLRGRYFWNQRTEQGLRKAVRCFQDAVRSDSTYARAHAGLADAYVLLANPTYEMSSFRETWNKAFRAAERALQLDPELAEAHASLAQISLAQWDWKQAEHSFKKAIALDPNYATAHHWYGTHLANIGRHADAIEQVREARRLEPYSIPIRTAMGWALLYARQFPESIEEYRACLEMQHSFLPARSGLGTALLFSGQHTEALRVLEELVERSGHTAAARCRLGHAYGFCGQTSRAEEILKFARAELQEGKCTPYEVAFVEVGLERHREALEHLQQVVESRYGAAGALRGDILWSPIRQMAEFQDLLTRIGLPRTEPTP
jgi:serine/threonine protein kinase/Tfp pilus assembly protein PilF